MNMQVLEIVRQVKSAIDELTQDGTNFQFSTEDSENLSQVIKDKIQYGLEYIIEHAPVGMMNDSFSSLTGAELANFTIDANSLVATLVLPDSVLRIVDARLSSWPYFPIPEEVYSQTYLMQLNEYARGSWDMPVNIIAYNNEGRRVLEMYCAKVAEGKDKDTLKFTCIRKPAIQNSGSDASIDVPSKLTAALVYHVAGLTMTAFREDIAQNLFGIARSYMGIAQPQEE